MKPVTFPDAVIMLRSPSTMEAAVWTAIGLLAALSLGSLFYLGARIDALGVRVDALGSRVDVFGSRLDTIDAELDSHIGRHAS